MNSLPIVKYLIEQNPQGEAQLGRVKRQLARKFKISTTSNINLLKYYRQALKSKQIVPNNYLENLLKTREIRTLSGVAPVAVLTKPYKCPGRCSFCPSETKMPKSYLANEPAVMRAIGTNWHPYKQVQARIAALKMTGHNTDKVELIIMGGTWSYLPKNYQNWYIKNCFDALNNSRPTSGYVSLESVEAASKKNTKGKYRCVGLTLETRPDYINPQEIIRMRKLGCTKVELGVQAIDDEILKLNNRGNSVAQIINATRLLKDAGFKVVYHLMPNLPGSSPVKDVAMYQEIFSNENFQPDMVKIYPCVVTKNSEIYKWWQQGKFQPYTDQELFDVLLKTKQLTPPYVRIIRLIRDIPASSIVAGSKVSNLRQSLQAELSRLNKNCRCVRCREIKNLQFKIKDVKLKTINYLASGGEEYFLSYEDTSQDKILAFLRLRLRKLQITNYKSQINPKSKIQNDQCRRDMPLACLYADMGVGVVTSFIPELADCAIIREVHTYGELAQLDKTANKKIQHSGWGKKLILAAEKIAKKHGYKKIAVIAAVGVRGYYQKLGYKLVGTYMVKKIK